MDAPTLFVIVCISVAVAIVLACIITTLVRS
jgi:hypothetical protein